VVAVERSNLMRSRVTSSATMFGRLEATHFMQQWSCLRTSRTRLKMCALSRGTSKSTIRSAVVVVAGCGDPTTASRKARRHCGLPWSSSSWSSSSSS
jgi:hypothetical protein